jgi:hypothetical protein
MAAPVRTPSGGQVRVRNPTLCCHPMATTASGRRKMRAQAIRLGDTGPLIIQVVNALPPMRYEVDEQEES